MRYMLLICGDANEWNALPQHDKDTWMGQYMSFTQEIVDSGEFVAGDPLVGAETAVTVRVRAGARSTTNGPFAETSEVLGGYYIVDVPGLDRALEIAARIPDARTGSVEVRAIADMGA